MRLAFRQTHLYRFVNMAERVGFEPTEPCGSTDFESASLRPLRYISMLYFQGFAGFRLIENQV